MMISGKIKAWLRYNIIVISVVLICLLLRYAWQGALGLEGLPEVVFLLSALALLISSQSKTQTERMLLAIVYAVITFLPYLGAISAFALLALFAFLFESNKGIYFFLINFMIVSFEQTMGSSGLLDRYEELVYGLQLINLALFIFLTVKVNFHPLYLFANFILIGGGALEFSELSIYIYGLILVGICFGLYRGVFWGTALTALLLSLYLGHQGLLFSVLVTLSLMRLLKEEKVNDICQLILVLGLFEVNSWIGYLFLGLFLVKLAANNRVKTCLTKSRLS